MKDSIWRLPGGEIPLRSDKAARVLRRLEAKRRTTGAMPAVLVGGPGPGTLGVVRSLSQANVPMIVLDENRLAPVMATRYAHTAVISETRGARLVEDLAALADRIGGPAVLFLHSDEAALAVSEHRAELENKYRFRLPSHSCLSSLIHKSEFRKTAEEHGFGVPRSRALNDIRDLPRLKELNYPCVVKPTRGTVEYQREQFARGYKVASLQEAQDVCRRILRVLPDLVVQEWIEGPDSDLYFCLQYHGEDGAPVASFTGRKLSIWPPDVGTTASCTAAPEVAPVLRSLTDAFFKRVSFVGMGGIEFKRDARTGQFLMIEPTAGRSDGQIEVATIHGVNIPLAAYCYEAGLEIPSASLADSPLIWRNFFSHCRSLRWDRVPPALAHKAYGAYWRFDDPMPALFHAVFGSVRVLNRRLHKSGDQAPVLKQLESPETVGSQSD